MRAIKDIKRELENVLDQQSRSYCEEQWDALEIDIQVLVKELKDAGGGYE